MYVSEFKSWQNEMARVKAKKRAKRKAEWIKRLKYQARVRAFESFFKAFQVG